MTGTDRYTTFLRLLPTGDNAGEQARYPLSTTESVVLGRDPHCNVVLDPLVHRAVSRRHAEVKPILGFESPAGNCFWQLCDLASANGTFLNGERLKDCQVLQPGDRIILGQGGPTFVFECQPKVNPAQPVTPVPASSNPPTATRRKRTAASTPRLSATSPPPRRREPDAISLTQLFPILSTGRQLTHKAYLLPGGITVGFVVLMFAAVGNPLVFNLLLAAYLAGAAYYFVYELCGKRKPWWILAGAALVTLLLLVSPALTLFVFVFRQVLPGELPTGDTPVAFPILLIKMFFGAGLMEELLKAVPVFAAYFLGTQLRSPYRERIGVWEPLDGILLGSASAVGFTLLETMAQYLPEVYKATLSSGEGAAQLASLQLLIPRVLGSVAGHMAYSGYFGYFIGLSVLRSRRRWLILGIGYLSASGLHALWNTVGSISPVFLALVGLLSYAFLAAAILKARELSPTRSQNFATRFYK
ncbi:PrsW family intramembrane metalloprotease [Phormidium sp. FACHB-592]|uniref:PrsW family glutamic-type intramembrane protease n=2 Tax=Leptolyngbyaceae TaxID=1890438 RepID=A0ABV0KI84_9CYAN|nr:PrsW family glutamic-type intramembrane protease [Phormidium sp. FACHB-592]MBD2074136.1 PrsW family intramembrane metalloprotease [Phormidium sp. FACHB-592]